MLSSITVLDIVNKIIEPVQATTAIELGVGRGGILGALNVPSKLGVDNYSPDLYMAQANYKNMIIMNFNIMKLMDIFFPKSFDIVVAFDVLEHFEPEYVPKIIEMCESLAKKMVIFWFPLEKVLSKNVLSENPGQEHKSILQVQDFNDRGYESIRFPYYWRIPRMDPSVDGCLCFTRVGGR